MAGRRDKVLLRSGELLARGVRLGMRKVLRPVVDRGNVRPPPLESGRRLLLIQLDGVSRARLEWAMREGHMPLLERRLGRGRYELSSCRSGAPASTPAFQAALFYGVSPSVPGFVWWDRERKREVRMDSSTDASAVEERLAQANPGLLRDGTAYFSIFSGAATVPHFCLTGWEGVTLEFYRQRFNAWDALGSALVHSVTGVRMAGRLLAELGLGIFEAAERAVTLGRVKHEGTFLLHRLLVGAFMRELAVQALIVDIARGVPALYCDLLAFDEYAHRRGPDSEAAIVHLESMDATIEAIFAAVGSVPELGYDVYLLSDHGHVATRPFESFTGLTLPEYLSLAGDGVSVPRSLRGGDATRLAQARSLRAAAARLPSTLRAGMADRLDRAERRLLGHALGFTHRDGVVTAEAGDLAHVYFAAEPAPLDFGAIQARHPRILSALRESRAVGVVGVRGGRRGFAVVGATEIDLADPGEVARLPHPEPALLATYLSDLLSIRESGDLVVLGWRGEGKDTVAYAWEFGSHGGVSPEEISTFVVHPRGCGFRFADVVRPDALYRFFDGAYRRPRCEPRRPPRAPRTEERVRWA